MSKMLDADPAVFEDESLALQYIINTIINQKVNTCEVVRVVSVDSSEKEVSVIPIVKNVDANGEAIEESEIYGIKYIMWQYGKNALVAEPSIGDIGIIITSKRDISKIDAGIVDSRRKFNLADSIYIGGLCGFNQAPTQFIKFDENGIEITSPTALTVNAPIMTVNAETSATVMTSEATVTATGGVAISGSNVSITGSTVSIGSGSGEKAVALDGDKVYSGTTEIGIIKATSTVVKAN